MAKFFKDNKRYNLVNLADGNDRMALQSEFYEDAVEEALELLGWTIVEANEDED